MKRTLPIVVILSLMGCSYSPRLTADRLTAAAPDELEAEWRRLHHWQRSETLAAWDGFEEYAATLRREKASRSAWSAADRDRVEDGRVWVGATSEQALWAWGPPKWVETDRLPSGVVEAWRYGPERYGDNSSVIYLRDDLVVFNRISSGGYVGQ